MAGGGLGGGEDGEYDLFGIVVEGKWGGDELVAGVGLEELFDVCCRLEFVRGGSDGEDETGAVLPCRVFHGCIKESKLSHIAMRI